MATSKQAERKVEPSTLTPDLDNANVGMTVLSHQMQILWEVYQIR